MTHKFEYVCILDFEATCDNNCKNFDNEIIEFPSVLLKLEDGEYKIIDEFQYYCKPKLNPTVTNFCYNLTGITQGIVNNGNMFPDVLKKHYDWLITHCKNWQDTIIVTCGRWDLGKVMITECKKWQIVPEQIYHRYINIKDLFDDRYKTGYYGMAGMLKFLQIELEGRHHSGIDDSRNLAKIFQKLIIDGCILTEIFVLYVNKYAYKNSNKYTKHKK